ncbi:MAG: hypothetical protein GY943_23570 [Chloroflexi bacterium]|nr:hypothetical protein [Chloroflexota bacterium]
MAPDAAGDSLHVGLDGTAATTADKLTGFQPNAWTWSRTTMDNLDQRYCTLFSDTRLKKITAVSPKRPLSQKIYSLKRKL